MNFLESYIGIGLRYRYRNVWNALVFLMGYNVYSTLRTTLRLSWHSVQMDCVFSFFCSFLSANRPCSDLHRVTHCPLHTLFSKSNRTHTVFLIAMYHLIVPLLFFKFVSLLLLFIFFASVDLFYLNIVPAYFKFMLSCVYCLFLADGVQFGYKHIVEMLYGNYIYRVWAVYVDRSVHLLIFFIELLFLVITSLAYINFYLLSQLCSTIHIIHLVFINLLSIVMFLLMGSRIALNFFNVYSSKEKKKSMLVKSAVLFAVANALFLIFKKSIPMGISHDDRTYLKL
ncbi:hypothetical protein NEMIN01_1293 [Nematocida minor]|uniref:uncharacterized protein n=1 Tax=Nematocida minor TaxID=1912983 RepID=UPI00221F2B74|nr:uncharacterized protein NEMIN01_1293 [Nematocida minor]KAI5190960.1 hypothetical protein NEMIN01_1293 [Nematocida minor]